MTSRPRSPTPRGELKNPIFRWHEAPDRYEPLPNWVRFLGDAGFEAVHWSSVGAPNASDDVLMQWARANQHVVFTHDLDFSALLAMTRESGPSVIQVRTRDPMPEAIGHDVIRVLRLRAHEIEQGAIVTIDRAKSRVRLLPIG